ncbi:MAG: hypothetical protein ABIJ05_03950 [Patescibacteria group bacterium]
MSKVFYDRLIVLENFGKEVKKKTTSKEEEFEIWNLVDDILGHKVIDMILDKLPLKFHDQFIEKFLEAPYDETLFEFLKENIGENIEELIKQEIGNLAYGLLEDIREEKINI